MDNNKQVIKSVQSSDQDILESISELYLDGNWFDLDPCYSVGKFYDGIRQPGIKMDKMPSFNDVIENNILKGLPLENNSIKSIVFDHPFMFGKHGKTDENIMTKRFTMFDTWDDLKEMYQTALSEFYRVLGKGGIVAFKCQDYTDSKTTLTHCYVWQWAMECGFYVKDIFIHHFQGGRIWNSNLKQRHSRKYHSYWMVLEKTRI